MLVEAMDPFQHPARANYHEVPGAKPSIANEMPMTSIAYRLNRCNVEVIHITDTSDFIQENSFLEDFTLRPWYMSRWEPASKDGFRYLWYNPVPAALGR
jgi:hypothetical protein